MKPPRAAPPRARFHGKASVAHGLVLGRGMRLQYLRHNVSDQQRVRMGGAAPTRSLLCHPPCQHVVALLPEELLQLKSVQLLPEGVANSREQVLVSPENIARARGGAHLHEGRGVVPHRSLDRLYHEQLLQRPPALQASDGGKRARQAIITAMARVRKGGLGPRRSRSSRHRCTTTMEP